MPEFSTKQREKLAEEKEAMPDGSYPIRNRSDLKNAIQAFGRSKNPEKTKAWIKRRARELDAEDLIPESWLKHSDSNFEEVGMMEDQDYLIHYGVLGMKWGVHRAAKKGTTYKYTSHKTKSLEKKNKKTIAKYDKKLKKGSLHGVLAVASAASGLKGSTNYHVKAMEKKEAKWKSKKNKYSDKLAASKKSDSNRLKYAKKTSVGKGIAQQMLAGPIGAGAYQKMRANNVSRGKAIAATVASQALIGNIGTYAVGSYATTRSAKKKKSK